MPARSRGRHASNCWTPRSTRPRPGSATKSPTPHSLKGRRYWSSASPATTRCPTATSDSHGRSSRSFSPSTAITSSFGYPQVPYAASMDRGPSALFAEWKFRPPALTAGVGSLTSTPLLDAALDRVPFVSIVAPAGSASQPRPILADKRFLRTTASSKRVAIRQPRSEGRTRAHLGAGQDRPDHPSRRRRHGRLPQPRQTHRPHLMFPPPNRLRRPSELEPHREPRFDSHRADATSELGAHRANPDPTHRPEPSGRFPAPTPDDARPTPAGRFVPPRSTALRHRSTPPSVRTPSVRSVPGR